MSLICMIYWHAYLQMFKRVLLNNREENMNKKITKDYPGYQKGTESA